MHKNIHTYIHTANPNLGLYAAARLQQRFFSGVHEHDSSQFTESQLVRELRKLGREVPHIPLDVVIFRGTLAADETAKLCAYSMYVCMYVCTLLKVGPLGCWFDYR